MNKKASCDTAQSVFESAMCTYASELTTACDDYDSCRETAILNYNQVKVAVNESEYALKADYQAANQVICYISVLNATTADEKSTTLDSCHVAVYDDSHLDILYPAVPDPAVCDTSPADHKPCDTTFLSMQYTSQPWHTEAPSITCTACAPPVQSTIAPPATTTTTTGHPTTASPSTSCTSKCGGYAGSCWCDTLCPGYNDCCGDYYDLCVAATTTTTTGHPTTAPPT